MVLGDKIKTEDCSEKNECKWDPLYTILAEAEACWGDCNYGSHNASHSLFVVNYVLGVELVFLEGVVS